MSPWPKIRRLMLALTLLPALMAPATAHAQSCALCYTQAAASGARMIQALKSGILILIIPPMGLTAGVFVIAYRRRQQFKAPDEPSSL